MTRWPPITGAEEVAEARQFIGDPYVFGGAGPSVFDCSGLIYYTLNKVMCDVTNPAPVRSPAWRDRASRYGFGPERFSEPWVRA